MTNILALLVMCACEGISWQNSDVLNKIISVPPVGDGAVNLALCIFVQTRKR